METGHNRKQFLGKSLGSLVAGTALAVSNPFAYSAESKSVTEQKEEEMPVPTYEVFRTQLIQNKQYDEKKEGELRRYWEKGRWSTNEGKKKAYLRVSNPEKYLRKYVPDEKQREFLRKLNFSEEQKKSLKDYFKCPWTIDPDKLSDKIYIYESLPQISNINIPLRVILQDLFQH